MRPSAYGPGPHLAVRLELREDRLPQAFLPGNLLDIQYGSYGVSVTALTRGTGPPRRSKQQGAMGCSRGVDSSRRDAGVGTTDVVIGKPG